MWDEISRIISTQYKYMAGQSRETTKDIPLQHPDRLQVLNDAGQKKVTALLICSIHYEADNEFNLM